MKHEGAPRVQAQLGGVAATRLEPEPAPVRHLRAYSAYLAPRLGFLSADTWTLVATLFRNLLLNWIVLVPLLCAGLMLPRIAVSVLNERSDPLGQLVGTTGFSGALFVLGAILGTVAIAFVHSSRPTPRASGSHAPPAAHRTQSAFIKWCLVPLAASAALISFSWWIYARVAYGCNVLTLVGDPTPHVVRAPNPSACATPDGTVLAWFVVAGVAMHVVGWLVAVRNPLPRLFEGAMIGLSGAAAGWLAAHVGHWLSMIDARYLPERAYVVLAVPAFLLIIILGGQLYIGLASRVSSDAEREWSARFNAWMLVTLVSWLALSAIVLYGPPLVEDEGGWVRRMLGTQGFLGAGGLSGLVTLLLGRGGSSPATPDAGKPSGVVAKLKGVALALAAPTFAVFLVVLLSQLNAHVFILGGCWVTEAIHARVGAFPTGCQYDAATLASVAHPSDFAYPEMMIAITLLLLGAGLVLGWLVDSNKFSLHAMYRARLIRTFLGASRPVDERAPDPFTGFDENDNLPMGQLWPAQARSTERGRDRDAAMPPLHVVNTTLNLVAGQNLAWQQRKAESFTVSSLHAGSPFVGYRRTSPAPGADPRRARLFGGKDGITLGTAVTISGAAASPNAGYHSSPAITFLMTMFNARLGWWLGNTNRAGDDTFDLAAPRLAVGPVLSELFGLTTDRSRYVYLSDGGHFENLGLYEMVLRRCRFILVSDAGCDPTCTFEDLGNAMRKIRVDLGVSIEFPDDVHIHARDQVPGDGAGQYWAVGRIRYSRVDRDPSRADLTDDDYDGILLYVKPALYGDEPRDVYNYARTSPTFPHESTTDQFFGESQFESYRSLGAYIVGKLCEALRATDAKREALPFEHPLEWFTDRARRSAGITPPAGTMSPTTAAPQDAETPLPA